MPEKMLVMRIFERFPGSGVKKSRICPNDRLTIKKENTFS